MNPFDDEDIRDLVDPKVMIEPVEINPEEIQAESKAFVSSFLDNLGKFYYDSEFIAAHPEVKTHIDADLESLAILMEMRKSDEITHRMLVKAIGMNPSQASLYQSLTKIQKSILDIQNKMDETIKSLNNFIKGYQLELTFDNKPSDDSSPSSTVTKGSKSFIEQMKEKKKEVV